MREKYRRQKEPKIKDQDRFFTRKTANIVAFVAKQPGVKIEETVRNWEHKQILSGRKFEIIYPLIDADEKTIEVHIYDPAEDPNISKPYSTSETKISEVHFGF